MPGRRGEGPVTNLQIHGIIFDTRLNIIVPEGHLELTVSLIIHVMNVNISVKIYLPTYGSTALVYLGRFFSFLIYTQSVGFLGRGISPSQGRYLHTEQHKRRINAE
jgi:hypothetical protein